MSALVTIDERNYEAVDLSVVEASTPLSAGDSTGQVGTISFTIPAIDPDIQKENPLFKYGDAFLQGKPIKVWDEIRGVTSGEIMTVSRARSSADIRLTATSRLGILNVYNIQAQPFVGTMEDAFTYYMSLAGVSEGFRVEDTPDRELSTEEAIFQGWNGELWYYLKLMASAHDCDLALVSDEIVLRPLRKVTTTQGRNNERTTGAGGGTLAQSIEIIQYNNRYIENELVYPPGGWNEDVPVITVNAGQTMEQVLNLEASVSSIVPPEMRTFVGRLQNDESVYTIVGDDGLPIPPALWEDRGGKLTVTVNPDTTSLTVRIIAPVGLPNKDGTEIAVFGVSLADSSDTGRFSTLRILGTGVAYNQVTRKIPTGIDPSETATEVGITIDNPFLSTSEQVTLAGARAVRGYDGTAATLSGTVVSTVRGELSGGKQVFGNVAGARSWDEYSRRWYRVRDATVSPDNSQITAEDDLLHGDLEDRFEGLTYEQVAEIFADKTYKEVDLMGVPK